MVAMIGRAELSNPASIAAGFPNLNSIQARIRALNRVIYHLENGRIPSPNMCELAKRLIAPVDLRPGKRLQPLRSKLLHGE